VTSANGTGADKDGWLATYMSWKPMDSLLIGRLMSEPPFLFRFEAESQVDSIRSCLADARINREKVNNSGSLVKAN
jgi:hypothetical protein